MNFDRTRAVRVTVKRTIRWIEQPTVETEGWGCVEITQDRKSNLYLIRQIPADFGSGAFHLQKLDADLVVIAEYDVCLVGRESTCSCPGFSFAGHCRHVAGLLALEKKNELPHRGLAAKEDA